MTPGAQLPRLWTVTNPQECAETVAEIGEHIKASSDSWLMAARVLEVAVAAGEEYVVDFRGVPGSHPTVNLTGDPVPAFTLVLLGFMGDVIGATPDTCVVSNIPSQMVACSKNGKWHRLEVHPYTP